MKTWPLPLKTPGTYLFRLVGIGNHRNWSDVETFAFLEFVGLVKSNPSLQLLVRYLFEAKFVRATRGLVEASGTLTEGFLRRPSEIKSSTLLVRLMGLILLVMVALKLYV